MRKTIKNHRRLVIGREVVRVLSDVKLRAVHGGVDTNLATTCNSAQYESGAKLCPAANDPNETKVAGGCASQ